MNVDKIHNGLEVIIGVTFLLGIVTASSSGRKQGQTWASAGKLGPSPNRA